MRRGLRFGFRYAAVLALPALLALAGAGANAEDANAWGAAFAWGETYAGAFAGVARADNRIVDRDGFSNPGNPGWAVAYRDSAFMGGVLVGKRFAVGGVPLRLELDGAFGGPSATTNRIDPRLVSVQPPPGGADETVVSTFRWIATARAGIERAAGSATTLFAAAGLAVARIENALTDLDRGLDRSVEPPRPTPWRPDPDDSFHDASTEAGWTLGAGVETALADGWALRLEGLYLDFGRTTHRANLSGDNSCCGSGSPRRPVSYTIENRLGVMRLAAVRRFD